MEMSISAASAAIFLHSRTAPRDAAELVRRALARRSLPPWPRMELELFPGRGGTLILARPASDISVEVADYALPFLSR